MLIGLGVDKISTVYRDLVSKGNWLGPGVSAVSACMAPIWQVVATQTSVATSTESKPNQPLQSRDPRRSRGCGLVMPPSFVPPGNHGSPISHTTRSHFAPEKGERKTYKRLKLNINLKNNNTELFKNTLLKSEDNVIQYIVKFKICLLNSPKSNPLQTPLLKAD